MSLAMTCCDPCVIPITPPGLSVSAPCAPLPPPSLQTPEPGTLLFLGCGLLLYWCQHWIRGWHQ